MHLAVVASTTSPEIAATGVVSAPVMAADEVEESLTATPFISPTENTNVSLIGDIKAEEKTVPTVVAASPVQHCFFHNITINILSFSSFYSFR